MKTSKPQGHIANHSSGKTQRHIANHPQRNSGLEVPTWEIRKSIIEWFNGATQGVVKNNDFQIQSMERNNKN